MPVIDISQGDTEQIIPDDQANREYIIEASGATVRVAHNERYARKGTEIQAGDRVKLNNLRSDSMFAHATDGDATLRIDQAGANVTFMQRASMSGVSKIDSVTEVQSSDVSDRAAREIGKARIQDSGGVLIDPATESSVTSEQPRAISSDNVGLAKDATVSSEQPRSVSELSNTSTVSSEAIDPTNSFSDISVPDGMTAKLRAESSNADPVIIDGNYGLDPGETVTLRVTSLADIPISGTSGDEIQAIVGGGA